MALVLWKRAVNQDDVGKPVVGTIKESGLNPEDMGDRLHELIGRFMNAAFVAAHPGAA